MILKLKIIHQYQKHFFINIASPLFVSASWLATVLT